MELHHVLRQTDGGTVDLNVTFFFIDLDGKEYLAYYDRHFRELYYARIDKRRRKWTITPMEPEDDPAVWELLCDLEGHCLESDRRGLGETYALQEDEEKGLMFVRKSSGSKLHRFAHGIDWRNVGSWVLTIGCALLVAFCILTLQEKLKAPPEVPKVTLSERRAELPAEEDYLEDLRAVAVDEAWAALSETEKQAVLQQVCNWETTAVLGCSACTIQVDDLTEGTLGYYDKQNEAIFVSRDAMEKGGWQTALRVVIHESRHAWQRDMIGLLYDLEKENPDIIYTYPFDTYAAFRETWLSYTSGLSDYESYYDQVIEQDSRAWAEERLTEYYLAELVEATEETTAVP